MQFSAYCPLKLPFLLFVLGVPIKEMRFLKALGKGEVLYMQEERDGGGTNTKYLRAVPWDLWHPLKKHIVMNTRWIYSDKCFQCRE